MIALGAARGRKHPGLGHACAGRPRYGGRGRAHERRRAGHRRVDDFQQDHKVLSVIYAVTKKYGDDNAGVLVSSLTLSAFGTLFPLLLLLVTILGLVLSSHPAWRSDVLHSTLPSSPSSATTWQEHKGPPPQQPLRPDLRHLGLLWGSLRVAQNGIFTMEQVWNVPGPTGRTT